MNKARYIRTWSRLYCRHGLIVCGTGCVTCEREAETAAGQLAQREWQEAGVRGMVIPPGGSASYISAAEADAFAFRTRADQDRIDRAHHWTSSGDARHRSHHWNPTGQRANGPSAVALEVITDPSDPRGIDARRVREAA